MIVDMEDGKLETNEYILNEMLGPVKHNIELLRNMAKTRKEKCRVETFAWFLGLVELPEPTRLERVKWAVLDWCYGYLYWASDKISKKDREVIRVSLIEMTYHHMLKMEKRTVWLDINRPPLLGQLWLTNLVWKCYEVAYKIGLSPINYPLHLQASIINEEENNQEERSCDNCGLPRWRRFFWGCLRQKPQPPICFRWQQRG